MDEPVLKNVWDADVPASDPRFVLAVMARAEARRFRRELFTIIGLAAAAILLLALVMPTVEITWREGFAPYVSNLAILLSLMGISVAVPFLLPARD
jgi:hypothetical protein